MKRDEIEKKTIKKPKINKNQSKGGGS